MIPLSRWLSDGPQAPAGGDFLHTGPDDNNRPLGSWDSTELEIRLADAREQARRELRQETAAMISAAREDEQQKAEVREQGFKAEWTAHCAALTASALCDLKLELQGSIGKALDDILQPLLPIALRRQSTVKLFELLDREFETAGDEILEVRAPSGMHGKLRSMLDEKGLQAILTESPRIEVQSRHGPSRFEALADAWASFVLPRDP